MRRIDHIADFRSILVALASWLAAGGVCADPSTGRVWTVAEEKVQGAFVSMLDDGVTLGQEGKPLTFPFGQFAEADQRAIVDLGDTDQPPGVPGWIPGYAVRYRLRLMDDPLRQDSRRTVMASIPTGGWLKPDASDLRVVTQSGKMLPVAVLSHDPQGNTLLQFERNGMDRWYWVYAVNPRADAQVDDERRRRIAELHEQARSASVKTMELRRDSAEVAGELRDVQLQLERARSTLARAEKEIEQLVTLIPERRTGVSTAEAEIPPLEAKVAAAEAVKTRADAEAERMMARVRQAEQQAQQAEAATKAAAEAHAVAERRAATVYDEMEKMRIINEAQAVMLATRKVAEDRKAQVEAAREAALPSRMAVAGAQTELENVRKELAGANNLLNRARQGLNQAVSQKEAAEKLKAAEQAGIKSLSPRIPPLTAAAEAASAKVSAMAEKSDKLEVELTELSRSSDPRTYREGLSVEFRDWGGDRLDELSSWPVVVEGLMQSDNVLGCAVVTDVLQKMNPFRLGDSLNFAASYRGFLKIDKPGLYRFFLNADDAAFLFLNDYLVSSRVGSNRPEAGRLNVFAVGQDMEMDAGVYRIEIHQVTGNTPGALGRCAFYWILPGARAWTRVPPDAFVPTLAATLSAVEAYDGRPVAIPRFGVAGTLTTGGFNLHLVRFTAAGVPEGTPVRWHFGDGLEGSRWTTEHVYFGDGDYRIRLSSHPSLPPYQFRFHVWNAPVERSPLTLGDMVRVMETYDVERLDVSRLGTAFSFLSICGQDTRWPLMDRVTARLLKEPGQDLQYRINLYTARMEALARQGHTADAITLGQEALREAGVLRSLTIAVEFKLADIYRHHLKDFDEAGRRYARIVEDNQRLSIASVRLAAIAWGDMLVEMGDSSRAAEIYRLAAGLGRPQGVPGSATEATTRGAMLRVAEQQLRAGNIRHTRQLLERIEQEFPEQKVEGLYRFLLAEADRHAGRYIQSIRNYEVLLRLQQWAGYRAMAMSGMADCYYRLEQFEDALRWLDTIRDAFPDFFEQRKLAEFHAVVSGRLEVDGTDNPAAPFEGLEIQFDPGLSPPSGMHYRYHTLPGISDNALVLTRPTDAASQYYDIPLTNVISEGAFRVDFWYRNDFMHSHAVVNPEVRVEFFGDGGAKGSSLSLPVIRTFGQTFMAGALVRAPVTQNGRIRLTFSAFQGLHEIQGIRVRPVSAFEEEALLNFTEGIDTQ